jgi:hypothetical protein
MGPFVVNYVNPADDRAEVTTWRGLATSQSRGRATRSSLPGFPLLFSVIPAMLGYARAGSSGRSLRPAHGDVMKRFAVGFAATLSFTAALIATPQITEPVDAATISKIRDEGLNRSQVMDTVFWLADRYGPRLVGSPEIEEAGDWAMQQLQKWGVQNVRKERFPIGKGWSLVNFHATMTAPRVMPIIGVPKAWTPGIASRVSADVVRVQLASEADCTKLRGTLRGKIVLAQPARGALLCSDGDLVLRSRARSVARALSMPPPRAGAARGSAGARRGAAGGAPPALSVARSTGRRVALFDRGAKRHRAGGDLTWQSSIPAVRSPSSRAARNAAPRRLPQVTSPSNTTTAGPSARTQVPVKVDSNCNGHRRADGRRRLQHRVDPGTDKADEIVLIGAHFDSWQGATGATDNATGSAEMMEVLRIVKTLGLHPRRTIRIGLWGGEEAGLVGSRFYASEHLGTRAQPKPENEKHAAYFNLDNGTGKVRGIWMQQNAAVEPIFRAWIAPLKDLGVDILGPRSVSQTDHTSFDSVGVPAFQFVQERYEYNSRTHHTNMDFVDRVQAEDVKQAATVAAVFAWQAATREEKLPRKPSPGGGH